MNKLKKMTLIGTLCCACLALGQTTRPDSEKEKPFKLEDTSKVIKTFDDGSQLVWIQTVTQDTQTPDMAVVLWKAVLKQRGTESNVWSKSMTGTKEWLEAYKCRVIADGPIFDAILQNKKLTMLYLAESNVCLCEIDLSGKEPQTSNMIKLFDVSWDSVGNVPLHATLLPSRSKLHVWFEMANWQAELWEVTGTKPTRIWRDEHPDVMGTKKLPTDSAPSGSIAPNP